MLPTEKLKQALVETAPDDAHTLPAELYTAPEALALEQSALFESYWQLVGHLSQLSDVGDQIVCQVGRVPIVVVRDQHNQLTALHNVCRHRAGPVATSNGNSKVLRCKYHGWTYSLDGALKGAPEMSSTPGFDSCQYHLPKAKVGNWQGLVFVCISDNPPPLEQVLEGIADTIQPIDINAMGFHKREEYVIDCNWKVYMDNYLEGYHLPHVHPGLSKLLDYRSYDTILHRWHSYQFSPLVTTEQNTTKKSDQNFYGEGQAHYYCVFPNIMLNILPGRLQTNVILPQGESRTKVIFDYYYSPGRSNENMALIEQDEEFSDQVQQEDVQICEQVQRGLASGSYHAGRLCIKRESGLLHYQNLIRRSLSQALEVQFQQE